MAIGEFLQIMQMIEKKLRESNPKMEVRNAFPKELRRNPQAESLAVVGIQKVSLLPMGMENFYGESLKVMGRKAEVWVKVSFCCPTGERCWKMWEDCAQSMLFSKEMKLSQAECGEAVFQKDWGGIVLPVRFCMEFIISGESDGGEEFYPKRFQIVRKGETI